MTTNWRQSLVVKWTCIVGLLLFVVLAAFGFISYQRARETLHIQICDHLETTAQAHKLLLRRYIDQQCDRVLLIASRTELRDLVRKHAENSIDPDEFSRESQRILFDALHSTPDFTSIAIVNSDGIIVTSTEQESLHKDVSNEEAFRLGSDRPFLSLPRTVGNEHVSLLAVPALGAGGQPLGFVFVELRLDDLIHILQDKTGLRETVEVLVGSPNGERIRYLFPPRHSDDPTTPREQVPAMRAALDGQEGVLATVDSRNVRVLASFLPVGYQGWGMVVKIDESEAYQPISSLSYWLLGIGLFSFVVGVVLAYFLVHRLVQPLRQLTQASTQVGGGEFATEVLTNRDDEIGTLTRAFNQMTQQLAQMYATLDQRVLERTKALRESNEELKTFASVASHDLQSPLRLVSVYLGFLQQRYEHQLDEKANDWINTSIDAAKRMKTLIQDLLAFTRVDKLDRRFTPVDCNPVVEVARQNLRILIEETNATLIVGPLPTLQGDKTQLLQLFQNLIGNGIKFRSDKPPEIRVEAEKRGGHWLIRVQDNGIGMESKYTEQIFGLCQRLHSQDEYPGTGIGLALCQRIIARHRGRIWVESQLGLGSTFFCEFPNPTPNADEDHPSNGSALAGANSSE